MVFPIFTLYLHSIRLISPIPQAVHLPNHHTVRGNVVFSHSPDPRSDFLHLSEDIAERDPQVMDRLSLRPPAHRPRGDFSGCFNTSALMHSSSTVMSAVPPSPSLPLPLSLPLPPPPSLPLSPSLPPSPSLSLCICVWEAQSEAGHVAACGAT
jgi:hypothetical protein